jgi:hypothetical protein
LVLGWHYTLALLAEDAFEGNFDLIDGDVLGELDIDGGGVGLVDGESSA